MIFKNLEKVFDEAKEIEAKFIAVIVEMKGFNKPELIVNHAENIDQKLDYYRKTYDENLNHKHAPGIRIINGMCGDSIEEFQFEYNIYCKLKRE